MDLSDIVKGILTVTGVPALFMERPKTTPCISFHFFGEGGILYGDGKPVVNGGKLQVDIFTTGSTRPLRRKVIDALTGYSGSVRFVKTYPDECGYEGDVKLYHHVIVFEFYYNTESEVI